MIQVSSSRFRWQPTLRTEEVVILLIYPITCILGQLVYMTDPADSYFSNKKNIFNVLLVKNGWFWTTVAAAALLAYRINIGSSHSGVETVQRRGYQEYRDEDHNNNTEESNRQGNTISPVSREGNSGVNSGATGEVSERENEHSNVSDSQSSNQPDIAVSKKSLDGLKPFLIRYAIATTWFILFTQWCFGLPLMDKIFVWTGGSCQGTSNPINDPSSSLCRNVGGKWLGGFDPSGHSFLLVLSSLYLWFELLPLLRVDNKVPILLKLVLGVLVAWWWMFLMTAVYFHSFAEKLGGMIPAYLICSLYLDGLDLKGLL
jgi:Inositol phospholipid synthesis and fat-storage-inducing TM